jgi:hypothetical protein
MKTKKLKLIKDVLKVLTSAEMVGVVGGTALPGTVAGCDSTK